MNKMPDEVFDLPNPPEEKFIQDCVYRVLSRPSAARSAAICKLISMEANFKLGIMPAQCAQCRFTGEVNPEYIRRKVVSLLKSQMKNIQLGFYQDREEIKAVFRRGYKHMRDGKNLQFLLHQLMGAMHNNRLTEDEVNALVREMPDIMKPPEQQKIEAPVIDVLPAKQEDRALDVDFGCCGGRDIFHMLGDEELTLTSPSGHPFTIRLGDVGGVQGLPKSNMPNTNTLFRLKNGTIMIAAETADEVARMTKDLANAATEGGKASLTEKLMNAGKSVLDVARSLYGEQVCQEEYGKRKAACEQCQAKDANGERLFRPGKKPGWYSCGVPWYRKPMRDPAADGCGCWLHVKWAGKNQKCPLSNPRW
jgi:hypothetical protein